MCHLSNPSICNLQLFLLSHVIPVTCSSHQLTPGQMVLLLFSFPLIPPPEGPKCAVDASWPLGGMNFIALLVLLDLYICVKILKFTKSSHFTKKTHHQSILRIHSSYSKATRCRLSEVPSNKLTLKIKKRKKGFGFGRVKIAFATSHERIIKMDNDNNHMQEKVTNTYHLNLLGRVPKYGRALDSVWG